MRPCLLNSCAACATPILIPRIPWTDQQGTGRALCTISCSREADEPKTFAIKPPCPPIAFAEVLPHIYKSTTDDERAPLGPQERMAGTALRLP